MEYVTLNDCSEKITDYVASGSFASLKENVLITNDPNYAVMVKTADFSNGFSKNLTYTDKKGYDFLHNSNLFGGELILSNIGSIGKVFIVPKLDKPMTLASNSIMVKPNANYDTKFLYYLFSSSYGFSKLKSISSGTSMQKFNKTMLKTVLIPKYTLLEQQKIAAHLDSIQSAIDNKKQQLQQLDELVKSKFVEMFGENPVESGKWIVEKLDELCSKISDGVHAKPEYTETGMPFISVVNMNTGKLSFNDCKFVSVEAYEKMIKSTNPEKDDVLYTKVGATYGISALVDTDKKFCLYVSVALLKPLHDKIDSQFLTSTMMMPYVKQQADNSIKGIGVPDLHLNQIRAFKIAVPPIELQNTFAEYVQKIDSAKSIIKTQLVDLQELLDSKMDEYFGE